MFRKSQTSWLIASAFLIFFVVACFYKLDRFSLWQDEAETALLGKSILQNGLPYSFFDGKWVTQFANGQESTTNHLWHITPWLPFYLCALGLKIFGLNDWAARFPFALAGVLSALLLFIVALRWTKSHAAALLALFFYVTNPTVIIYTRQCKYLPVYLLGYLVALYGILSWIEKKGGTFFTILGFLILFYTNFLAAGLALSGFGLYALATEEGKCCRPLFFKTVLGVLLFFGPFLLLAPLHARMENHIGDISLTLGVYLKKLGAHVYYWNGQVFPLLLAPLLLWRRPPYFKFIGCTVLVSWLLLPLFKDVLRYNLHLIPVFCLLLGFLFANLFRSRRVMALLLFAILIGTNFFQNIPDAIAKKSLSPLFSKEDWVAMKNYYFKDYVDPIKVIPPLIAQHSRGTENVYLNHDQLVWQWYSDIPFAYLAEADKMPERNPPLDKHWTDREAIDWWIGPHYVKMIYGLTLPQEEIEKEWTKAGYKVEVLDTQIPIMNWDLNSPIRYKHFLDKFSGNSAIQETIKLVHRVR